MANGYRTEQENFWAGGFGDAYIDRNRGDALLASNIAFFARALARAGRVASVAELGANIGMNLVALRALLPGVALAAVEINAQAAKELSARLPDCAVTVGSLLDWTPPAPADLALVKGVLIHLAPEALPAAYDALARAAGRHLLLAEYYNPTPVEVPYRGERGKLFKRDFAGEFLDRHPEFALADYGFAWRRDPLFPQDDLTWFLLERKK